MSKNIKDLFAALWHNYIQVTPTAHKIHEILGTTQNSAVDGLQSDIVNDHIALRTFNIDKVSLDKLAMHFQMLGYVQGGQYNFTQKKLFAKHFEHPDKNVPKVFISQLLIEEFSPTVQDIIRELVAHIDSQDVYNKNFLYSGRHWDIESHIYEQLLKESEYAAWMYIWGYGANHFTVNVNELQNFKTLKAVNDALLEEGFKLNEAGGLIKGSPEVLLEQSATLADEVLVDFGDKSMMIPSCFYEFAYRYAKSNGELYSGFVEASANKIFESTDKR